MAIEVGALVAAIEADASRAIAEVKRFQNAAAKAATTLKQLQANTKTALRTEAAALRELNKAKADSAKLESKIAARAQDGRIKLTTKDVQALTAAQHRLTQATQAYNTAVAASKAATAASSGGAGALDAMKERVRLAKEEVAQLRANAKTAKADAKEIESTRRSENAITQDGYLARFNDRIRAAKTTQAAYREQEQVARRENAITQDEWVNKRAQRARVEKAHGDALKDAERIARDGNKGTQTEWQNAHYRRQFMRQREIQAYAEDARRSKANAAAKKRDDNEVHRARMRQIREQRTAEIHAARMARASRTPAARSASVASGAAMGAGMGLSTLGVTGTLVGTLGVHEVFRAAEAYQLLQARLSQVTETREDANLLFRELSNAAVSLRVPLADATELFVKLRQSNANVNMSYGETIRVTRAFSAALRISGATGQTASSALLQFGQAMAKGNLDGDEFRTIAENNSEVLRVLADYLNKSGIGAKLMGEGVKIGRGELLKLREEGKITSKMLADALDGDLQRLESMATKLAPTMTQAMTNVRNSFVIAIGGSSDLQEAFGNIAKGISSIGDAVRENTPIITGVAKWGAAFLVARTGLLLLFSAVKGVAFSLGVLASMHPVVRAMTLIAGAAVYLAGRMDFLAAKTAQANAKLRETQMLKPMSEQAADFKKARDTLVAAQRAAAGITPTTMIGEKKRLKQELAAAQSTFNAVYAAYRETYDRMALLDSGRDAEATGTVVPSETAGTAKAAADLTDQFIRDMDALTAAGLHTEAQMARLNAIFAATKVAMTDADPSVAAEALGRYATITEVFGNLVNQTTGEIEDESSAIERLLENYELLVEMGMQTVDQSQLIEEMYEEKKVELAKLTAGTVQYYEALKEVARLEQLMRAGDERTPKEPASKMTNAERRTQMLQRQLFNILSAAPGELIVDFFEAIGSQVDDGAESVAERMRQGFGNIFGNIGQSLIQNGIDRVGDFFRPMADALLESLGHMMTRMGLATGVFGKLLLKIKAALANPLVAGFAMVGLGAAMVAYGRRMGGIGRGGSAEFGGGGQIGGLGVGGQPLPGGGTMPIFGQGPMFPNASSAAPVAGVAPMTVNATIIGPNDPQAQRQIAHLVDNAARRGLVSGGGMRT